MKKRMQITISEEVKKQMDDAKEFYGGYSGIIEKAVIEFFSRPIEPYDDDVKDIEEVKRVNEWIDLAVLKGKIRQR